MPRRQSKRTDPNAFGAREEHALQLRQSPKWLQAFAIMLALISGGFLTAGYLIRIDEVVTANGELQSAAGRVMVKSPVGGKIARVLVSNGELVKQGQLLVVMDTVLARERLASATRQISLEKQSLQKQLASLKEQISVLDQQITTQKGIVSSYDDLAAEGSVARLQSLQQRDRLFQLQSERRTSFETIDRAEIEAQKTIRELDSQITEAKVQLQYQNIPAPADGVVFDSQVQDQGVIQAGDTLMTLIPQSGLLAHVKIPNKDIGFVKLGQKARVRVDAFPANRYGELDGQVSLIGADALPPDETANFYRFPVTIQLDSSYLTAGDTKIPLTSGMSITSNLRIRDKRLITIVSDIFSGQFDSIRSLRQ
jgi:hemolysin D